MNHTPGPWRAGTGGSVVADAPVPEISGSDAVEYYGGHLIAESIAPRNKALIAAAPELLAIAKRLYAEVRDYHKGFDAFLWVELEDVIAKAEGSAEGV